VDEIARSHEAVFEVHPEVSFRAMAGQPLKYSKSRGMALLSGGYFSHGTTSFFPTISEKRDWLRSMMCWMPPQLHGQLIELPEVKPSVSQVLLKNSQRGGRPLSGIE
jgi:hypothetical protein